MPIPINDHTASASSDINAPLTQRAAAERLMGLFAKATKEDETADDLPGEPEAEEQEDADVSAEEYEAIKARMKKRAAPVEETPEEEVEVEPAAEETEVEETPEEPEAETDPVVFEDDEGKPVTRSEAIKGHLRHRDYTVKTQAAAAERKVLATETESARKARADYAQGLEELKKALGRVKPKEPDWDKLQQEQPDRYPIVWAQWQQLKEQDKALDSELQDIAAEKAEEEKANFQQFIETEHKLVIDALPQWKDETKKHTEVQALIAYAKSRGFTDSELNLFTMSKLMLLLRTAMNAERKPTPKGTKPNTVRPGLRTAAPGSGAPKKAGLKGDAVKASRDALKKSGSRDDAVRHILNLSNKG